jgi:hypothetical protein
MEADYNLKRSCTKAERRLNLEIPTADETGDG